MSGKVRRLTRCALSAALLRLCGDLVIYLGLPPLPQMSLQPVGAVLLAPEVVHLPPRHLC